MKHNKGITIVALIITIIILLIISGFSINIGYDVVKKAELENMKTNMLLIKAKGKEYVENANFKLGTNLDLDKLEEAKNELKGNEVDNINSYLQISLEEEEDSNYIFYYFLETSTLEEIGITNVKSSKEDGWYIIKYDLKNIKVEVYNTKGYNNNGDIAYSLSEIQAIE